MKLPKLNYKRGLFRAWGVGSVLWGFLMLFLVVTARPSPKPEDFWIRLIVIVLVPLLVLGAGYVVAWILRGFKEE